MRKTILGLAVCVAAFSNNASAQNTFPASGNVGIGTTTPVYPLDVNGVIAQRPAIGSNMNNYLQTNANVNSSTTSLNPGITVFSNSLGYYYGMDLGYASATSRYRTRLFAPNDADISFGFSSAGTVPSAQSSISDRLIIRGDSGNVGVGTMAPGAKLEVDGNVKLTSGSGASITFQDGTVQSTAYTGVTCGGDYAESVDVTGNRGQYEPGDVLVLDTENPGSVLKSDEAYSTAVSGIYSTKPGIVGRRQTSDPKAAKTEVPMAMMGIVPTKVSTENGSIKVGDLLVSSSTTGYAMKGTDRSKMLGAVIGKAMGNLNAGRGTIEVLVSLQ
jgi:hypothetical protein